MSDEYQLRKDIDRIRTFADVLEDTVAQKTNSSDLNELFQYYDTTINNIFYRIGLDQPSSGKFNFATVTKTVNDVTYEEFWILSNARYDYDAKRFVKIDGTNTSFGIQIQANGTYPGEAELGYTGNVGINIWRNPPKDSFEAEFPNWETDSTFDFSYFMGDTSYIGLEVKATGEWKEYGYFSGWTNSFMIDSYGGMTIGGSGFEIDGNGIFPYTRLTHSKYTVSNTTYYLLGFLDNAYHSLSGCDDNSTYSWFVGLRIPESTTNRKDNVNASFVVMYNDTTYNSSNIHELDNSKWHIVFQVNKTGIV